MLPLSSIVQTRFLHKLRPSELKRMMYAKNLLKAKKAASSETQSKPIVKGVVFDMDGTLTVPCIDFLEMRRRVGILEGDILDAIAKMSAADAAKANAIIAEIEKESLKLMAVMPGTLELARLLDRAGVPRGLITRNVQASVAHFHSTVLASLPPFAPALARCFTPYKPAPHALLHICERWGIEPAHCVMVGDSPKDDIVCGNRAGATTILIDYNNTYDDVSALPEEHRPTFHVRTMQEVQKVLLEHCELRGTAALLPDPCPAVAVSASSSEGL